MNVSVVAHWSCEFTSAAAAAAMNDESDCLWSVQVILTRVNVL